jgi:hypothetical protein
MVSIQDKIAQLLAIDKIRQMIETYRMSYEHEGVYKDIYSGQIYQKLKEKGFFKSKHDVAIGLCVDGFSSKSGNQSLVMISVIIFSIDPSDRYMINGKKV